MTLDATVLERLPTEAREKMYRLDAAATAAHGAVRSASDRLRSAEAAADAARKDYQSDARSRTNYATQRLEHPEPAEREKAKEILAALDRKRQTAEAAAEVLDRARATAREAEAAWQEVGGLLSRLANFVLDLSAGTVLTPVNVTAPKLRKGELPIDAVTHMRDEIAEMQAEAERIELAPVTADEARERAKAWVEQMAACAVQDVDAFYRPTPGPVVLSTRQIEVRKVGGGHPLVGSIPDPIALAVAANHETFLARLLAEIDAVNDDPQDQIPLADRPGMLAELTAKLETAERAEEAIITAAAEAGTVIPRRSDARPEVVLGVEVVEAAEAAA